ncbi:MAG: hypothetical protein ACOCSK_01705 [Rhodothermales bacterium]
MAPLREELAELEAPGTDVSIPGCGELSDGTPMELNIVCGAHRSEEKLRIVGEAKSQLSRNAIDNSLRKRVARLPRHDESARECRV